MRRRAKSFSDADAQIFFQPACRAEALAKAGRRRVQRRRGSSSSAIGDRYLRTALAAPKQSAGGSANLSRRNPMKAESSPMSESGQSDDKAPEGWRSPRRFANF